jgi:hypothetical protein
MQESPSASTGVSSPASAASPAATEIVTRPEPGLARGKWEAPEWFFWATLAGIVLGSTAYLLRRLGMLRLRPAKGPPQDALPPSSRARRP